jgi:hypothetical protein
VKTAWVKIACIWQPKIIIDLIVDYKINLIVSLRRVCIKGILAMNYVTKAMAKAREEESEKTLIFTITFCRFPWRYVVQAYTIDF